jgi:hypothetical protein
MFILPVIISFLSLTCLSEEKDVNKRVEKDVNKRVENIFRNIYNDKLKGLSTLVNIDNFAANGIDVVNIDTHGLDGTLSYFFNNKEVILDNKKSFTAEEPGVYRVIFKCKDHNNKEKVFEEKVTGVYYDNKKIYLNPHKINDDNSTSYIGTFLGSDISYVAITKVADKDINQKTIGYFENALKEEKHKNDFNDIINLGFIEDGFKNISVEVDIFLNNRNKNRDENNTFCGNAIINISNAICSKTVQRLEVKLEYSRKPGEEKYSSNFCLLGTSEQSNITVDNKSDLKVCFTINNNNKDDEIPEQISNNITFHIESDTKQFEEVKLNEIKEYTFKDNDVIRIIYKNGDEEITIKEVKVKVNKYY